MAQKYLGSNTVRNTLSTQAERTAQKRSVYIPLINSYVKYIVYKTINLHTGQYYYGKHKQLSESFDGYFGSSAALAKDILNLGKEAFFRETLCEFDSEAECYLKEQEIISDKWKSDPLCYNKQPGDKGLSSGNNHYSSVNGFSPQHIENLKKSRKKDHLHHWKLDVRCLNLGPDLDELIILRTKCR